MCFSRTWNLLPPSTILLAASLLPAIHSEVIVVSSSSHDLSESLPLASVYTCPGSLAALDHISFPRFVHGALGRGPRGDSKACLNCVSGRSSLSACSSLIVASSP